MKKLRNNFQHGFTLMETLLAITLFAIVITSSFGVFSMGIQIWKRTTEGLRVERKIYMVLERMGKDVRESLPVLEIDPTFNLKDNAPMVFQGEEESFLFPAVLPVENSYQTGALGYAWDRPRGNLCRQVWTQTDFSLRKNPVCRSVASDVTRVEFEYLVLNSITGTYSWYKSWDGKKDNPRAIKVSLEILPRDKKTKKRMKAEIFEKTFWIPVSDKAREEVVSSPKPEAPPA